MSKPLFDDTTAIIKLFQIAMQAQALSERTISERAALLRAFFTQTPASVHDFTAHDIMRYCARPGLSQATVHTYWGHFAAFCEWCTVEKIRKDNPLTGRKRPKRPKGRPRPFTREQACAILNAANRKRTRAFILLALYAGLRVHEIAKIHGEDIDLDRGSLTVIGKGANTQIIPLHKKLLALAEIMPRAGYWFPAYTGTAPHIGRQAVQKAISDAIKRAGVHGTPHQLRHTYGTLLVESGADLRTVQTLMRHESLNTTAIYVASGWGRQASSLAALDFAA